MTILTELRVRTRTWHPPSLRAAVAFGVIAALCLVAMLVDQRTLQGAPVWTKPFKFAVSGALYFLTWSWLVTLLPKFRRTAGWITNFLLVIFSAEYALVVFQAARVQASHFNIATDFDAAVYGLMGNMIVGLWLATLALTVLVLFSRVEDRASFWAVRLGSALSLVGLSLGFLMTNPTAQQQAVFKAGGNPGLVGAHTVGLADGGPGLPIVGWSTVGGDLRIPHFIGMHALQALPLLAIGLGLLATRIPKLRDAAVRTRLLLVGAFGYAGVVALVTWQALRGQSIVHPDSRTLLAASALVAVVALGSAISLRLPTKVAAR